MIGLLWALLSAPAHADCPPLWLWEQEQAAIVWPVPSMLVVVLALLYRPRSP